MSLYADVIGMRHIADLLDLRESSAITEIRLNHLQRPVLEIGNELPTAVDSLASGDRDVHLIRNLLRHVGRRRVRLLEEHDIVFLQDLRVTDGSWRIHTGMCLRDDIHILSLIHIYLSGFADPPASAYPPESSSVSPAFPLLRFFRPCTGSILSAPLSASAPPLLLPRSFPP